MRNHKFSAGTMSGLQIGFIILKHGVYQHFSHTASEESTWKKTGPGRDVLVGFCERVSFGSTRKEFLDWLSSCQLKNKKILYFGVSNFG
jgi:hypothetical protein